MLLTILDFKRGYIADTMDAYLQSAFGFYNADAVTVLPYMGVGTLAPILPWFRKGKGVYVVWISSNPEARELQNLISQHVFEQLSQWADVHQVRSSVGLVL